MSNMEYTKMKNRKVLVVSAHPDDETLGAGGTLLKFKKQGDKIFWLNFTNKAVESGYSIKDVKRRMGEIAEVNKVYSFDGFFDFGLKPAYLSKYPRNVLIERTKLVLAEIKPSVVILPFKHDAHSDHRIVFDTVYSCTKVFRAPFIKEILMMEILSETEFSRSDKGFVPNYFVDISGFLDKKIKIMKNYKDEIGKHPFPRNALNMRSLAVFRGATARCQFAESFVLLKKIL